MNVYVVLTGIFEKCWCEDVNIEGIYKFKETAEAIAEKYNSDKHGPDAIVEEWPICGKKNCKL